MMATNDDASPAAYTPAYDLAVSPQEKNKLLVEKDFSIIKTILETANKLSQLKRDVSEKEQDDLEKGIDAMLKASAFAIANNPNLQERVNLERQGKNSP
ncbi:MAG TPA: hypothetical protein PLD88_12825, partial [Candidatus Berkiella sp.]|nr:hypothetical protein [Candidatus Berkiella sp.]